MFEEKQNLNIKWFRSGDIKLRQQNLKDGRIGVLVSIDKFNVCFTMVMYDFIEWCREFDIELEVDTIWNNHSGFVINSKDQALIRSEIRRFIDINNFIPCEDDEEFTENEWYS